MTRSMQKDLLEVDDAISDINFFNLVLKNKSYLHSICFKIARTILAEGHKSDVGQNGNYGIP